jgi:hypothetical protein
MLLAFSFLFISHSTLLYPAMRSTTNGPVWDEAPEGAEHVIPEEYRRRANGPVRWGIANLPAVVASNVGVRSAGGIRSGFLLIRIGSVATD